MHGRIDAISGRELAAGFAGQLQRTVRPSGRHPRARHHRTAVTVGRRGRCTAGWAEGRLTSPAVYCAKNKSPIPPNLIVQRHGYSARSATAHDSPTATTVQEIPPLARHRDTPVP